MIPFALPALDLARRIGRTFPTSVWVGFVVIGLVLVLVAFCTSQARQDGRAQAEARAAAAYSDALRRDGEVKERAAGERLADLQINIDRQQERTDATAHIPDSRPSDRRIARACVQLRQQGTADRDLPAACH